MTRLLPASALLGCLLVSAPAEAQTASARRFNLALDLHVDVGRAQGPEPPALPADWPGRFVPPNGTMRLESARHSWFAEWGLTLVPSVEAGAWRVGFPISTRVFGVAAPAIEFQEAKYPRKFVQDKLVSATTLQWWNPVVASSYAVRQRLPWVGVSLSRGRGAVQVAIRPYSLVAQQYEGTDVAGGMNYSKRISSETTSDGIALRGEATLQGRDADNPFAAGLFIERDGADAWQFGVRLRFLRFDLIR